MKHYHFIAIGGAAMHNLAIAIQLAGNKVTGSDDEIFDPAKSHLEKYGLLPEKIGWFPENITKEIDTVILGMHARKDNHELLKAQELGLKINSYPEFLYQQSKEKIRVVIGGSHGKTTTTAMILHVLEKQNRKFDYMVGAQLDGFEVMVKISEDADVMVIEGDEYLTSPIDLRPKFHVYCPTIAVINGIAWDHINVFPTFKNYIEQFRIFADKIVPNGTLAYYNYQNDFFFPNESLKFDKGNQEIIKIAENARADIKKNPYSVPKYKIENGITVILHNGKEYLLSVFGRHNLQNVAAARVVCKKLGIADEEFFTAITSFKGASKRLELFHKTENFAVFKDFAHSPSKLKATISAVAEQYPERELVACLELHTFSSLTKEFLKEYKNTMDEADVAIVYFNPHTIAHKKLPPVTTDMVKNAFGRSDLLVFSDSKALEHHLKSLKKHQLNLLMMSSGNFDGIF
ncbi:MAG: Mur ligase domain-containing protein [Bacteroidales bacterium]|jgi:UDP-N-acetylmuramate: L-alanyl-gamma-D-glutamyl-meso-diaminopimelate ligase|nr:Mur ligase domain-containing protein [Bacteroidales bacterium]